MDVGRLLDFAWLRLSPPTNRRRRGKLLPVTLDSEVRAFVEQRDGSLERYETFTAVINNLRQAQRRLQVRPLPEGAVDASRARFHYRYPASPAVDIPADGRFHQITIQEQQADCTLLLRVVPRQSSQAYRFVRTQNPLQCPLPSGPMQVYIDGEFTVNSTLPATGSHKETVLNLGVEERVRVARNATFNQSEKGMLTSSSILEHHVHTEIQSRLTEDIAVEVFERLPLHEEDDGVELALDRAEPTPEPDIGLDEQELKGALRWRFDLPAQQSRDVHYTYTITINARKELIGGNRREP